MSDSPAPPLPGDNLIAPQPCDAPQCGTPTTIFVATEISASGKPGRIIHCCPEHLAWAAEVCRQRA